MSKPTTVVKLDLSSIELTEEPVGGDNDIFRFYLSDNDSDYIDVSVRDGYIDVHGERSFTIDPIHGNNVRIKPRHMRSTKPRGSDPDKGTPMEGFE